MLVWKQRIKEIHGRPFKVELESFFMKLPENWLQKVFIENYWL